MDVDDGVLGDSLIPIVNRLQDIFSQVCVDVGGWMGAE
jgi:hypothetical protein